MHDSGLAVDLDALVEDLPVGARQRLEILKALYRGARILILDEPTAVLTPRETDQLFETLRGLRARGTTVLLITHKLKEILALCDAVTVMRQGRVVLDCAIGQTSLDGLAEAMVGRRVQLGRSDDTAAHTPGPALVEARGLSLVDALGVARLSEVSITLHAGEIVGIAGVSGNGQQELMAALSGEDPRAAPAAVTLFGQPIGHHSPRKRRKEGLHFVPEERLGRGAVPTLSLAENTLLTRTEPVSRSGWVNVRRVERLAQDIIARFHVRGGGARTSARSLSGGNLQKFLVGREISADPKLLIVSQPTWGVDVGAAAQIRGELLKLRDAGCALLVVSEELDELFEICDRLLVIAKGRMSPSVPMAEARVESIGEWMSGLWDRPAAPAVATTAQA
jgi:simple sugar transport system ATP-binding protein